MANCYTLEELQYEKHVRRDGDNCRKWTSRCCRPNTMWLGGRELWQVAARQWCKTVQVRLALGTPRDRTWNSIRAATGNQWSPIGSMRQWRGLVAPLYHVLARFWHVQIFFKVSRLVTTKLSCHFMNSVRKLWANKAQLLNDKACRHRDVTWTFWNSRHGLARTTRILSHIVMISSLTGTRNCMPRRKPCVAPVSDLLKAYFITLMHHLSYHFMNSARKLWANKAQLLNILKFSPRPGTHYPHSLTHCHDFFPHWHAKLHAKA